MAASAFMRLIWGVGLFCVLYSMQGQTHELYDARTLSPHFSPEVILGDLVSKVPKGSIVVIGEQHNLAAIQQGVLQILNALREQGHQVDVAMEFLKFTDQDSVDLYRKGEISEPEFKARSWGEADFNFYREQILYPRADHGEKTIAINSPKQIPLAVKERGLANLNEEEKKLLPPDFALGRSSYRERFVERMIGHVTSPEAMIRYFETQSVWDDTMAWKVCEAKKKSANTLVIIVGQFHVEYGDGFIDRLKVRCPEGQPITSIYQFLFYNDEVADFTPFYPSTKYGSIADYLMIVKQD